MSLEITAPEVLRNRIFAHFAGWSFPILFAVRYALLAALVLHSLGAIAQDPGVLKGVKIEKPPTIDGTIDHSEWEGIPSGEGAFDSSNGESAPENMRFWLTYDENYVYFAAKVFDAQPGSIRATEYRTNVSLDGDDRIALTLDLSGSLADYNEFGMNWRGATEIGLAGGRAAKREWSGEFVAQGRVTSDGWEVEARIPWKIMRLPGAGPRTLRFNVERTHQRTQREYQWRYTGSGQSDRAGRWTEVVLPRAPVDREIQLLPYVYAGYDKDIKHIANAGMDLKTHLSDQIAAVGSINPDFRNIENAILSLDFSRFERLAGETRPFFQEGIEYYNSALYASQRIPRFDAGLNVYGKVTDKISFGILDAADFGERNNLVANASYDPNPNDSFRATATALNRTGANNNAYLLRYSRQLGPLNVFVRNMGTTDTEVGKGFSNTASLQYFKNGFFGYLSYDAVSPEFLPRLGFIPEVDYKGITTGFEFEKPFKSGTVREVALATFWSDLDHFHGGHYRKSLESEANLLLAGGLGLGASLHLEDFEGVYDRIYGLSVRFPRGNPYRYAFAQYDWGQAAQEDYSSVRVGGAYRPVEKLQLTATYQHVDHGDRSDLGIIGWNYDMGKDMYVSGRAVKRDSDWNVYFSFRRSGNRGVEYYLILGDPNARRFRSSLILKVVWPFSIK